MENERELEIVLKIDEIANETNSMETAIRTVLKEVKGAGFTYMDLYKLSFYTDYKTIQRKKVKEEIKEEIRNGTLMTKMKNFNFDDCIN